MEKLNVLVVILSGLLASSCGHIQKTQRSSPFLGRTPGKGKNLEEDRISSIAAKNYVYRDQISGSSTFDQEKDTLSKGYYLSGAQHLNLKNYVFDFPVVYNEAVKKWLHYFLNKGKEFFVRYSERAGRYAPILGKILEDHGLPRDLIFLAMAESGFHNQAKSSAKAVGPWQFMPGTGKRYGLKTNWYVDERRDPIKSTIAASRYLKKLYRDFGSWELAAAGYNAGEGKVTRAIKKYKTENFWDLRKKRYLKGETKNYLPKIMSLAILGKNLESFGFKDIDFHEPLDFDEIDVPGNSDLVEIAQETGIPLEEVHRLNPELLRWVTPPEVEVYKLRLPVGSKLVWDQCCLEKSFLASKYQTYRVEKSQSLRVLAQKFRLRPEVLAQLNNLGEYKILPPGSSLLLPFREGQVATDPMYVDLFEVPKKRSGGRSRKTFRTGLRNSRGQRKKSYNSKEFYTVRRGDTLWHISRKMGISVDDIIKSNIKIVNFKRLREGDRLIIR